MWVLGAPSAPRPTTSAGSPLIAATACWTASASSRRSPFIGRPTTFLDIELWPVAPQFVPVDYFSILMDHRRRQTFDRRLQSTWRWTKDVFARNLFIAMLI